jgi:hypothetical protein
VNFFRQNHTPSQIAVHRAVLAREGVDPDDPQILPEARIVANYRDLADSVMKGNLGLRDAYQQVLYQPSLKATLLIWDSLGPRSCDSMPCERE